jgi:hypothetical protein
MSSFNNLLIHPHTNKMLELFASNPAHGLLVTGSMGSGKTSVVYGLSSKLLELDEDIDVRSQPYFVHITRLKNKQDISIEQIRAMVSALKLKVPGTKSIRRVVFIEDAQYLSIPAQNALLKILEEPSAGTVFILSATSSLNVLPTVSSRMQQIDIQPVSLASAQKFWSQYQPELVESAWRLSKGAPGLLYSLLSGKEHPLKAAVTDIKSFLRANKYERILSIDKLSKNREDFTYFLDALSRTLSVLHHQALNKNHQSQANALLDGRKYALEAKKALDENANSRLVALNLSLKLKV